MIEFYYLLIIHDRLRTRGMMMVDLCLVSEAQY
jgi:hypothetical protein